MKLDFTADLKRVRSCMRNNNIRVNIRKKKRNRIKLKLEYISENLLSGHFDRASKNKVWATDTTEVVYFEDNKPQKVRLHAVLDLYVCYVISYNLSNTETTSAVIDIFKKALSKDPGVRPMVHTDQGAAYCSLVFNHYLEKINCIHSMSHPGHPWVNSPMERWWNNFKLLWLERHPQPQSFEELKRLIDEGVKYFNTKRAYASKNGLTAEKFRNQTA